MTMQKKSIAMGMAAVVAVCGLGACTSTPGSMTREGVAEMLSAQKVAVTPRDPGWLLEQKDIHLLSDADRAKVCEMLRREPVREVDEKYYRKAELGNRGDTSKQIFYLYGDNYQCLGGRVVEGKRVLMDDLEMEDAEAQELYRVLLPYIRKLFPDLQP